VEKQMALVLDDEMHKILMELSPVEAKVMLHIWCHTLAYGNRSNPMSATFISKGTSVSIASVNRALTRLKELEHIKTERISTKGLTNINSITVRLLPKHFDSIGKQTRTLNMEHESVIDYYKEICGRVCKAGRSIDRKRARTNIKKCVEAGYDIGQLKSAIKKYRDSQTFKPDWVYSVTNFFGEKGYFKNFLPVAIMDGGDKRKRVEACYPKYEGKPCPWQLNTEVYEWCHLCGAKQKEGKFDYGSSS